MVKGIKKTLKNWAYPDWGFAYYDFGKIKQAIAFKSINSQLILVANNSVSELFNNTKFQTTSCQIIEALESLQGRSLIEITETEVQIHSILLEYLKQKLFKN